MKQTKIIATIGPVSESVEVLKEMIAAGLNVARFNFSHGAHEWHETAMQAVRTAAAESRTNIAVLADLQGPRIRTRVASEIPLSEGERVTIAEEDADVRKIPTRSKVIFLDCPDIVAAIPEGGDILIEDGLIRLRAVEKTEHYITADVIDPGVVKDHKGVNIPDAEIPLPTLTEKDEKDLAFALTQDVDFVALSFVRSAGDVRFLRGRIEKHLPDGAQPPQIIVKIERKEAIADFSAIAREADGVMIARGDLGIEMEPHKVTLFQKELIAKSLQHVRPVVVATQMLNSMIEDPRPTRAEIADVTNAVIDHTDAVMLSGETTVGKHAVAAVQSMAEIARYTEESPFDDVTEAIALHEPQNHAHVARGAYELSKEIDAKALVLFSASGYTARLLSHFRPERRILVATNNPKTYNQLALVWGVEAFLFEHLTSREACIDELLTVAQDRTIICEGDSIVTVLGKGTDGDTIQLVGSQVVS